MRRRPDENPEVPIAPMLDMAFNLLTFFIFTFKPAPTELQFNLNLLPAAPAARPETESPATSDEPSTEPAPIRTLTTSLFADAAGDLDRIELEEFEYADLPALRDRLAEILGDQDLGFDQAVIQVDPTLRYEYLVQVINIFSELKLTKVSFTELR